MANVAAPDERWRPVVGYEGLYEVSNQGRVKSLSRWRKGGSRNPTCAVRERILSPSPVNRYGHLAVGLSRDGVLTKRTVHSLVAEAFLGPRPDGMEVAHNDGDCAHNSADNLRYATRLSNMQDRVRHGTINSKLSADDVAEIRRLRGLVKQAALAERFGVTVPQISRIQTGRQWSLARNLPDTLRFDVNESGK